MRLPRPPLPLHPPSELADSKTSILILACCTFPLRVLLSTGDAVHYGLLRRVRYVIRLMSILVACVWQQPRSAAAAENPSRLSTRKSREQAAHPPMARPGERSENQGGRCVSSADRNWPRKRTPSRCCRYRVPITGYVMPVNAGHYVSVANYINRFRWQRCCCWCDAVLVAFRRFVVDGQRLAANEKRLGSAA